MPSIVTEDEFKDRKGSEPDKTKYCEECGVELIDGETKLCMCCRDEAEGRDG